MEKAHFRRYNFVKDSEKQHHLKTLKSLRMLKVLSEELSTPRGKKQNNKARQRKKKRQQKCPWEEVCTDSFFLYLSCTNGDSARVINCLCFVTVVSALKNSELYMH